MKDSIAQHRYIVNTFFLFKLWSYYLYIWYGPLILIVARGLFISHHHHATSENPVTSVISLKDPKIIISWKFFVAIEKTIFISFTYNII